MTPLARRVVITISWIAISLGATYLVFLGGGFPAIYSIQLRLVNTTVVVVILGVFLGAAIVKPTLIPRSRLIGPFLVALGALTVATLASEWPRFGWETVINGSAVALFYLLIVRVLTIPDLRPRIRFTAGVLTMTVAVLYSLQVVRLWVDWYLVTGVGGLPPLRPATANLTMGTPSIVAGVLILFGPPVIAWLLGAHRRLSAAVCSAFLAFAVLVSGSRSAWVGVAAATLLLALWVAVQPAMRSRALLLLRRIDRRTVIVAGALAAIAVVVLAPVVVTRLVQGGAESRIDLWEPTLAMFAQDPITGTGPGTWAFAWWAHLRPDQVPINIAHAHNVILQTAAELGVAGLVAMIVIVAGVVGVLRHARRRTASIELAAVAFGLVAVAVQCLLDNFADLPLFVIGISFVVAWIESASIRGDADQRPDLRARAVPATILVVMAIITATVVVPWSQAARAYLDGHERAATGDVQGAVAAYAEAAALDPGMPPYWSTLGTALVISGRTDAGIQAIVRAAELTNDPYRWTLAADLASQVDPEVARGYAMRAQGSGPVDRALLLTLGHVYERAGDEVNAINAWARLLAAEPRLAASSFWHATERTIPADDLFHAAERRIDQFPESELDPQLVLARLRESGGDLVGARSAMDTARPGVAAEAEVALIDAMAGDPAAPVRLTTLASRYPQDAAAVSAAGLWANVSGDPDAGRYDRWLALISNASSSFAHPPAIIGGGSVDPVRLVVRDFGPDEQVYLRAAAPFDAQGLLGFGFE